VVLFAVHARSFAEALNGSLGLPPGAVLPAHAAFPGSV